MLIIGRTLQVNLKCMTSSASVWAYGYACMADEWDVIKEQMT